MNSHYTYLLINVLSVIFPLLLSFDKKVAFYKSWRYVFPSILITAVFFISWDVMFTEKNIWSFNPDYILGITIFNLPLEEVLFFFCVPYSCIFIYEVMNAYVSRDILGVYARSITIFISFLSIATCIVFYDKTYTIVNAGICFSILIVAAFIYKFKNLGRFYIAFLVSLIPFLIVDGIITALPIVSYNDDENMAIRIMTIPVEDVFYCLSMLLCPVILMDYFKQRHLNK